MRCMIGAALAATALSTPAMAMDNSWYAGIEAGLLWPQEETISADFFEGSDVDIVDREYKTGFDGDVIVGYDFGIIRLEGELAYKTARHDEYEVAFFGEEFTESITAGQEGTPNPKQVENGIEVDADGRSHSWSAMINALIDFNLGSHFAIYGGGGVGYHSTKIKIDSTGESFSIKDSGLAWQLIAGARYAVSDNLDIGVKYRYYRTDRLKEEDDFEEVDTRWTSHSVLASLIYNFAPAPPPPPPPPPLPPPPPETQTCPDGSVILATDACPPPPPPPPPPPEPERG